MLQLLQTCLLCSTFETSLTEADFQRGRHLILGPRDWNLSVLYEQNLFEGDIDGLNSTTILGFVQRSNNRRKRRAVTDRFRLWPARKIFYKIDSSYNEAERAQIARAIEEVSKSACVRFHERSEQQANYILIHPGNRCYSSIGMVGGRQNLSLAKSGCVTVGIIMHELLHALGFFHEQSRPDRDQYVKIHWENVQSKYEDNFMKYGFDKITTLGSPYDYGSIMHYSKYEFR